MGVSWGDDGPNDVLGGRWGAVVTVAAVVAFLVLIYGRAHGWW